MVCGATTFFINADGVQINWGHAQYQELALGEGGKKSSANPEKVRARFFMRFVHQTPILLFY